MEFLNSFFDSVYAFWNQLIYAITNIRIFDIIDIIIIGFIIYKAIEFLRDTRAGQLVKGIVLLLVAFVLAVAFNLVTLKWLITTVFDYSIVILVIIFQPELRRMLEKVGRTNIGFIGKQQNYSEEDEQVKNCIDAICKAVTIMSDKRIGALIVFEQKSILGEIVNTGTPLNAVASYELICNIFFPKSPLHDGALVIRNGTLCAAGCILPLTSNGDINSQLGTRHRAAIGMSENSDAIVLVVSEETGTISLAANGAISRDFNAVTLKEELYMHLLNSSDKKKNLFIDILSRLKKGK